MPSMAASGKAGRRAADYGGVEAASREPQGAGVSGRSAWSSRGPSLGRCGATGHGARPLARGHGAEAARGHGEEATAVGQALGRRRRGC